MPPNKQFILMELLCTLLLSSGVFADEAYLIEGKPRRSLVWDLLFCGFFGYIGYIMYQSPVLMSVIREVLLVNEIHESFVAKYWKGVPALFIFLGIFATPQTVLHTFMFLLLVLQLLLGIRMIWRGANLLFDNDRGFPFPSVIPFILMAFTLILLLFGDEVNQAYFSEYADRKPWWGLGHSYAQIFINLLLFFGIASFTVYMLEIPMSAIREILYVLQDEIRQSIVVKHWIIGLAFFTCIGVFAPPKIAFQSLILLLIISLWDSWRRPQPLVFPRRDLPRWIGS